MQQLAIGEEAEVERFYFSCFEDMKQSSCKIMAKAFVKLIEPKKQTHYPYTKGDIKTPPWWPDTKGDSSVRHREPDHISKPGGLHCVVLSNLSKSNRSLERIRLLVHILRMIVEPREKQCATVKKLGLSIKKLEEATTESMLHWFNDSEHPENAAKKIIMKEIFEVAKAEERYKSGETSTTAPFCAIRSKDLHGLEDGTTCIPETCDRDTFDGLDDNYYTEGIKNDNEGHKAMPFTGRIPTLPTSMKSDSGDLCGLPSEPARLNSQPQWEDHNPYGDSLYLSRAFQLSSSAQEGLNCGAFQSSTCQGLQTSKYGWQNSRASNRPMPRNFDILIPPQSLAPLTTPCQLRPSVSQRGMPHPPMNLYHFDMPNERYDSTPAFRSQLRTGSLHYPRQVSPGFEDYLHDGEAYGQHSTDPKDDYTP